MSVPEGNWPLFSELSAAECRELLTRTRVGRLAYSLHDRVEIVPIHFILDDEWIYGRTAPGGKLPGLLRNRWVAFEVDEHQGPFDWESVVVHGAFYLVAQDDDEAGWKHAIEVLEARFPEAFGEDDPVPFRNQLFRIHVSETSGRAARSEGGLHHGPANTAAPSRGSGAESDVTLRADVVESISSAIGDAAEGVQIAAADGVVILTGKVSDDRERRAVEDAVRSTNGVLAVVQQIETERPVHVRLVPAETGLASADAVRRAGLSPRSRVTVFVEHGWLRAEGAVETEDEHQSALREIRTVRGARGVIDRVRAR